MSGEQTTKDWREAWKRGADLLVGRFGVSGITLIRRVPGRASKTPTYDGMSTQPKMRQSVPVDFMVLTSGGLTYERTRLVLQTNKMPAVSGHNRDVPKTSNAGLLASAGATRDADGEIKWYRQAMMVKSGEPWSVDVSEVLDEYGVAIDELLEIARLDLPTGAYKLGELYARRNPRRRR